MKTKHIFIASGLMVLGGVWLANKTNALTYQDTADIQFTFDPSLSLTLTNTGNLTVSNLTPGTSSASGAVTITVATNSVSGYALSAQASGNGSLTKSGTDSVFTSLGTTAKLTDATLGSQTLSGANGVWGCYATSTSGGATVNVNYRGVYSGLGTAEQSIATSSTKSSGNGSDSGDEISFKIGAKAPTNIMSGDYTNTITFKAVTNVVSN